MKIIIVGAGQVGAALALYIRAKKDSVLRNQIRGAIIPGFLGIGEPLMSLRCTDVDQNEPPITREDHGEVLQRPQGRAGERAGLRPGRAEDRVRRRQGGHHRRPVEAGRHRLEVP